MLCKNYIHLKRLKNGTLYSGDWLDDMRHGYGKVLNIDGSFYEGFFK